MINIENIDKKYWVWLSLLKINIKLKLRLLDRFNIIELYNMDKVKLGNLKLKEKDIENILDINVRKNIDKHIEYMNKNNIDIVSIYDKYYPNNLKNIYDPPVCIYIKGNKNILNELSIGIVGCRECSKYGEICAKQFSYDLAKCGINIISGLARGVDSFSHIGTLKGKGKTIAVLGNGLDTIYPKENTNLANEILKNNGCIISEYPLGTKPLKYNFPARNRIISGISKGILVIEAKEKSGTLITVDFALEQGKDIYVIPGNIYSQNSVGTNKLIQDGAKPVIDYNDILNEYELN